MISFDNLFQLSASSLGVDKGDKEEVTLVSHAHTDHTPTRYKNNHLLCSNVTRKVIELRRKLKQTKRFSHSNIKSRDAGHILGSRMFFINNKLLYTGDFNPQGEYSGKARPVKCSTLIMECTYGRPRYVFPPKTEVLKELKEYVEENNKVVITGMDSSFGKVQELCSALDRFKIPFSINERILRMNKGLGLHFKHNDQDSKIRITDDYEPFDYSGYKKIRLTGWNLDGWWGSGGDKNFVFSSHSDYPSLVQFVKKCNPDTIYTHHGYAREFADDLRKMGFNAAPLSLLGTRRKKHQSSLFDFIHQKVF
ncbi:hypothetical protein KW787_00860 [Candidatus Pacearchaeota archaeon]|nr:hypothetical protein [Candidatus Pacearchaeota archaeon]